MLFQIAKMSSEGQAPPIPANGVEDVKTACIPNGQVTVPNDDPNPNPTPSSTNGGDSLEENPKDTSSPVVMKKSSPMLTINENGDDNEEEEEDGGVVKSKPPGHSRKGSSISQVRRWKEMRGREGREEKCGKDKDNNV